MKRTIKYIVIDIDGTMTDAGIYYDETGNELKKFCTKDAAGFFAANQLGIKTVILTGRECAATTRRLTELKATYIFQEIKNKYDFLKDFMAENNISKEEIAYIGDDLNDYQPMKLVGFVACPADACPEIKDIADFISPVKGGSGAVRDIIEHYLRGKGLWEDAVSKVYGIGV